MLLKPSPLSPLLSCGRMLSLVIPWLCSGVLWAAVPAATPTPALVAQAAPSELDKALDLAQRTLVFVEKSEARPAFAAALKLLQARVAQAHRTPSADPAALLAEIRAFRRQLLFTHPLLRFEKLLINKNPPTLYSHNCDQYLGRHSRVGDGPTVLENWKTAPKETVLLKGKLPPGAFAKLDLAYDGQRFLFAYADHTPQNANLRRFFLYEATIDGSAVRQLTGVPGRDPFTTWGNRSTVLIEDSDPVYLPDGGIAFVSTRSQDFGRCHGGRYTPSFLLHRADGDGGHIRQLSWGEANEVEPSVLPDGRLVYTRWEYVDRHEMEFHKLWSTRPDGTAPSNFYGNDTIYPLMIAEALPIPGTRKVVATGMGHHSFNHGTVIVIDPEKGENASEAITRITPEIPYPESNECSWETGGAYASPYPLSADLFLVAYSNVNVSHQGQVPPPNSFAIYLIDTLGGRELVYKDPNVSCFSPIPVQARPAPPALPSALPASAPATGTYLIQNVYLTRNDPKGIIKPGDIKYLRFNELINKPAAGSAMVSGPVPNALPKRILGTVPVNPDGSVAVTVPAGVPLQIQSLDQHGMALLTERSFHYVQPGEVRSCVGCHEPVGAAPPANRSLTNCRPVPLTPPAGPRYEGGLSFARTVQPVLDRYCIQCHGLNGKTERDLSLLGTGRNAYTALIPFTKTIGNKGSSHGLEKNLSRPKDYYAHGGKLGPMLLANHNKVSLDPESFARVIDWLDVNAQCYGDYSHNRVENRPIDAAGEKALREYIRTRFGEELAQQPFPALVNVAEPGESRILMAPLATAAGGWGQISQGGWAAVSDPDYQHARQLVEAAIAPLPAKDIDGTCGRTPCVCGSCWVRLLKEKGGKPEKQ